MSLFGGGSPDIQWEESLSDDQAFLRDSLVRKLSGFGGWEMPDYVSGPSGLQQAGFGAAERLMAEGLPSWLSESTRALATGQPSYTYDPTASERFYTEGLYAPAMRDFERDVLPAIAERYAGAGLSRSGDFQSALARAGADFATNLSAQRANLMRQDVSDARQAAEAAMGRMPVGVQLAGREAAMPVNLGLQVGGVQRDIQNQLGLQGLQQDIASQWWGNPAMGFLQTALTPTRMPIMSQGKDELGSALGGALSGGVTGFMLGGPVGALAGAGAGAGLGLLG